MDKLERLKQLSLVYGSYKKKRQFLEEIFRLIDPFLIGLGISLSFRNNNAWFLLIALGIAFILRSFLKDELESYFVRFKSAHPIEDIGKIRNVLLWKVRDSNAAKIIFSDGEELVFNLEGFDKSGLILLSALQGDNQFLFHSLSVKPVIKGTQRISIMQGQFFVDIFYEGTLAEDYTAIEHIMVADETTRDPILDMRNTLRWRIQKYLRDSNIESQDVSRCVKQLSFDLNKYNFKILHSRLVKCEH